MMKRKIGAVLGTLLMAALVCSAAKREDVDLYQWSVQGTKVTATAAELNQLHTGSFSIGSVDVKTNATVGGTLVVTGATTLVGALTEGDSITVATNITLSSATANRPVFTDGTKKFVSTGIVTVTYGGTGVADPTDHAVMLGSGSSALTPLTVGTDNQVLVGVTGADPVFQLLGGVNINDGSISNSKLASGISAAKLAAGTVMSAVSIANGTNLTLTVTTNKATLPVYAATNAPVLTVTTNKTTLPVYAATNAPTITITRLTEAYAFTNVTKITPQYITQTNYSTPTLQTADIMGTNCVTNILWNTAITVYCTNIVVDSYEYTYMTNATAASSALTSGAAQDVLTNVTVSSAALTTGAALDVVTNVTVTNP